MTVSWWVLCGVDCDSDSSQSVLSDIAVISDSYAYIATYTSDTHSGILYKKLMQVLVSKFWDKFMQTTNMADIMIQTMPAENKADWSNLTILIACMQFSWAE